MIELPEWATNERLDVSATSSLRQATAADRVAMMRAMCDMLIIDRIERPTEN